MKKIAAVALISLLLISSLFFAAVPAHADEVSHDAGHPGGTWQNDGNAQLIFTQNDAYETHTVVEEPWEFLAHEWPSGFNQRVTAKITIPDQDLGGGWFVKVNQPAYAQLIQKKEWVANQSYEQYYNDSDVHNTTWKKFYWTYESDTGDYYLLITFPSMDLPSKKFVPGMFEIDVKVYTHSPWLSEQYQVRYKLWGEFTPGTLVNAYPVHQPDPNNPNTYSEIEVQFGEGQWYVSFWYVKDYGYFNVYEGNITGKNGFTPQKLQEWGPYYKGTTKDFRYNFTANSSTGLYLWMITNEFDGDIYNLMKFDVYNNYTALHPNGTNGTRLWAPKISITLGQKGEIYYMNDALPITIHVDDNNTNVSTIELWLTVWYGNNPYFFTPPPSPSLELYLYPLTIQNHGNLTRNINLKLPGEVNVEVIAKDSHGVFNQTYASYTVDEGSGGGNNNNNNQKKNWLHWPWESTTSMVILFIGVVLIFSRNSFLKMIGLALIFLSFVNWDLLSAYIHGKVSSGLNPLDHLLIWRWKL